MTRPPLRAFAPTVVDVVGLTVAWIVAVVLVNPIGDFPLNDDWSYGKAVQRVVEDGVYQPTDWTVMSLLAHVLWGSLFTAPIGFSFTVLRVSTLVLSFGGVLGMYALARQMDASRPVAIAAALTLAANPIYFALSHTFMTDVPFTAWLVLASLCYVRHLKTGSSVVLVAATLLGVTATLTRQLGLCLPLGFAVAVLVRDGLHTRHLLRAAAPALATVSSLVAYDWWLAQTPNAPSLYSTKTDELWRALGDPVQLAVSGGHRLWTMLMYLGCFTLPLLVVGRLDLRRRNAVAILVGPCLVLGASVIALVTRPSLMPVMSEGGNIVITQGIGPLSLLETGGLPSLPRIVWIVVTTVGVIAASVLALHVVRFAFDLAVRVRRQTVPDESIPRLFVLAAACAYIAPLLLVFSYDRYVLPLVVLCSTFLVAGAGAASRRSVAAAVAIACLGIFAVAGTRDYLEWNRLRWHAIERLLDDGGVSPGEVNGGFEFLGWYSLSESLRSGSRTWLRAETRYVVAFGPLDGYQIVARYPYRRWLPPGNAEIVTLRRESPGRPDIAPVPKGGR